MLLYLIYSRIKQRRTELRLSQDELAGKMGYKSRTTISKIEAGEVDIPQSKIIAFANALSVTPSYLMGWEDYTNESKKAIEGEITLDDFEYALFGEVRELDEEDKQELLRNAQRFNELRKLRKEKKKPTG